MARVAVFGTGYVGCVTAACLSRDGHQVIGVDIDAAKVAAINDGRSPVAEPGLDELVARQVASGSLQATDDVARAVADTDLAMIAVGTPSTPDGGVSTEALETVIESIGQSLRSPDKQYSIVLRSTLLPGILEERLAPRLSRAAGRDLGSGLNLYNNPEFLRESSAIRDYNDPPFIIVGTRDGRDATDVLRLYDRIDAERISTDTRTAALVKYACNAFHAVKVSFANEIGALARTLGADGHEVMRLVATDRKLNVSPAYLKPGFAFGGSCLPKDLRALLRHAQQQAIQVQLLAGTLASNEEQLQRAVDLIRGLDCRRIGLVGLSFKAGTDDLRESPQVLLAETLLGKGHDVRIYDPGVSISRLRGRNLAFVDQRLPHLASLLVDAPEELCGHAELLVLATECGHPFDWRKNFSGPLIDLRRDLAVANPGA